MYIYSYRDTPNFKKNRTKKLTGIYTAKIFYYCYCYYYYYYYY